MQDNDDKIKVNDTEDYDNSCPWGDTDFGGRLGAALIWIAILGGIALIVVAAR